MTDTIIQFKYSDNVHMVAIYIKSDTHQTEFIPFLYDVVKSCQYTAINRHFGYVIAEIIAKITNKYESLLSIALEDAIDTPHVIYKYIITVSNDFYVNKIDNKFQDYKLLDYLKIKYIETDEPFDGLLKDFYNKIITIDNSYLINELEVEIEQKQKRLENLKLNRNEQR